ncbi:hypothetical protein AB4Y96_09125 [Phyllobacterium sp. TAF24]|uniref:hypothetical protein n=1 Tax=Phyllobacterium sp. TAF24 TaxID=3233068 RepID=UPI003F9E8157
MSCSRGKAAPNPDTKLNLFSASGGFCQNPKCNEALFPIEGNGKYHIAEMAHVFAANDAGPRANAELTAEERGHFDNLILLCPTCHTKIDKDPDAHPDKLIIAWKKDHIRKIAEAFGAIKYENRGDARRIVEPIIISNGKIHQDTGPDNEYRQNPEAEEAAVWQHKVLSQIIPNNRKLVLILMANVHLMNEDERKLCEEFKQHVDELEAKHLGNTNNPARRFPAAISSIFLG